MGGDKKVLMEILSLILNLLRKQSSLVYRFMFLEVARIDF
jgi:hypothetical protein